MPPGAFVAGDVLDGGAPGFAHELGETRLMDHVATAWFDPNPSDVLQTFDQTEHGGRCGGFRHLSQPREPTQAGLLPTLRERIEPTWGNNKLKIRVKSGHKAISNGSGCGLSGFGRFSMSRANLPKRRICSRI